MIVCDELSVSNTGLLVKLIYTAGVMVERAGTVAPA